MDSVVAKRIETELLGREVDDWKIESRIDAGKSAVVFRANGVAGPAAVKIFDPEMVERYGRRVQLDRIERELRLKGKHHPNLIKILGGGECTKTKYLFVAMELIEAPNLGSILEKIPRDRVWPLISQVASAARFLESLDLAHRDIKPGNIVVTHDFQRAVLLDLGVLKPFGVTGLTDNEQKQFVGTLQYSPPEFLIRVEDDSAEGWRAVTFYQLGAVLHDLIMKRPIFADQADPYGLLARAVERVVPRIDSREVPADLVVLAASCLQKDPKLRLDLVKWEEFDPPDLRGAIVDDPISRIRRRRAMAQQASSGKEISDEQRNRSLRRTVEKLQAALQGCAQQECIGSEFFPPLEIHDAPPGSAGTGAFKIQFGPSTDHALSGFLSIFINLELLDQNSEAIRISCAGVLSDSPQDLSTSISSSFKELFKGVYNQSLVYEKLRTMLYTFLDRAQQSNLQAGGGSDPIFLNDEIQGEATE
jgi:eukaryotic-like serine/threonine-protein kinase